MSQTSKTLSPEEAEKILKYLKAFPGQKDEKNYIKWRCKIGDSQVTLYTSNKLLIQGSNEKHNKEVDKKITEKLGNTKTRQVGIDETGRGEASGPLVIAAVLGEREKLREVRDSKKTKKVSEKKTYVEKNSLANIKIVFSSEYLDELRNKGTNLNKLQETSLDAIAEFFEKLGEKNVLADGKPLKCRKKIRFLVKGDDSEPVISAASVLAKNEREQSGDKKNRKTWGKKN